jgi:hypothetical protein
MGASYSFDRANLRRNPLIFNIERPHRTLLSHSNAALLRDLHESFQGSSHQRRQTDVPRKMKKETAMKQSRTIEIIRPTLRRSVIGKGMSLANVLTIGAALMAVILSVTLSSAADTDTCERPFDLGPAETAISAPCDYR